MIEGTVASIPPQGGRKHPQQVYQIDTSNILFICGGAFSGLEKLYNSVKRKAVLVLQLTLKTKMKPKAC